MTGYDSYERIRVPENLGHIEMGNSDTSWICHTRAACHKSLEESHQRYSCRLYMRNWAKGYRLFQQLNFRIWLTEMSWWQTRCESLFEVSTAYQRRVGSTSWISKICSPALWIQKVDGDWSKGSEHSMKDFVTFICAKKKILNVLSILQKRINLSSKLHFLCWGAFR